MSAKSGAIFAACIGAAATIVAALFSNFNKTPSVAQQPQISNTNTNSNNQNQGVIIQGPNNAPITLGPATRPPDIGIQNALIYDYGDETGVSMTVTNISSAYEELHHTRVQFYDNSRKPIQIVQTQNSGDIGLPQSGSAALVFYLAARPQIFQICTDIVDPSGKAMTSKRIFMAFQSFIPAGVNAGGNASRGNLKEVTHHEAVELEQDLPCPSEQLHSATSCSPGFEVAPNTPSRYPSDVPALAQEAERVAQQKASDARIAGISVSATGGETRLVPAFEFVAQQSNKNVNVSVVGCRLQAVVSDYDGSGWPIFDGPFVDLSTAVAAASQKGFRGVLVSADLHVQKGRPQPFLAWHLSGNWAADIGTFFVVTARPPPPGKALGVWKCNVTSIDGSRYACSAL